VTQLLRDGFGLASFSSAGRIPSNLTLRHEPAPSTGYRVAMALLWHIRSRSRSFAVGHSWHLNWSTHPSPFAIVHVGRICKQGVVGSSPIVSTL